MHSSFIVDVVCYRNIIAFYTQDIIAVAEKT